MIVARVGGFNFIHKRGKSWLVGVRDDAPTVRVEIVVTGGARLPPRLKRALEEAAAAAVEFGAKAGELSGDLAPLADARRVTPAPERRTT